MNPDDYRTTTNLINLIRRLAPERYVLPEELQFFMPHNDEVWKKIEDGPNKDELPLNDDPDAVCTKFAEEWLVAAQALTNMVKILKMVVEKHNIRTTADLSHTSEIPPGIKQMYLAGDHVLAAHDTMHIGHKRLHALAKIRGYWGSVTAYERAPEEERKKWLDSLMIESEYNILSRLAGIANSEQNS